ncbi:MAG TPA: BlaI/MecI/CopY family transcriptional regulator, partial [Polyangia bacterium]|nr:BlaI/MecI/CopY family transcriptional regulator [Polyangia bacterium]
MEQLTDLQLAVMKALWRLGEGTVSDVGDALARNGRKLAPTTVATLLQRLAAQGWVAHRREGRQFAYRAKVKEAAAAQGALARARTSARNTQVICQAVPLLRFQTSSTLCASV